MVRDFPLKLLLWLILSSLISILNSLLLYKHLLQAKKICVLLLIIGLNFGIGMLLHCSQSHAQQALHCIILLTPFWPSSTSHETLVLAPFDFLLPAGISFDANDKFLSFKYWFCFLKEAIIPACSSNFFFKFYSLLDIFSQLYDFLLLHFVLLLQIVVYRML